MPLFTPEIYIGAPDSGDYFTSVLPPAATGRLQSVNIREGQDEDRPFQRPIPNQFEAVYIVGTDRPYEPGQLVIARVVQDDGTYDWFRGIATRPDYATPNTGRTVVTVNALGMFDRLRRQITIANRNNVNYGTALGLVLTELEWPTDAAFRIIDPMLSGSLSSWAVPDETGLEAIEAILNTAGPPARILPLRNGGIQAILDIGTIAGSHVFDSRDLRSDYDRSEDDQSLVNVVTLSGTDYTSSTSSSSEPRPLPSSYKVLPGLPNANRAALAERIFDAYEFGLSYLTFNLTLTNPRVYDRARRLRLGAVIAVDLEGQRRSGYIASLDWGWRTTIARVRVGMVVKGNIVGVRFPPVFMYGGFKVTEYNHPTGYTPSTLTRLARPTGLSLTEASGDITADWNDVGNATGYVLEWREQGSGDAWQTANVSAPPRTFTP